MGTQIATTGPDYGSLFRPRARTQAQRDADAEAQRRSGDYSSNTATRNNAPSAGDQRGGENRGVDAPRTFKAREKNMEYKDHIDNLRQLRRLATESNGRLTFPTTELKNKYTNSLALAQDYEENNTQCDLGNSIACNLSGRGSFPTDYPSPFTDSIHYNQNSYFGVGDGNLETRQSNRPQGDVSVAVASDGSVESSQDRVQRERDEAEDERIRKENENGEPARPAMPPPSGEGSGDLPPPSGPEPANIPSATDGSGKENLPKPNDHRDPISGGGTNAGGRGGTNHGPEHFEPLPPPNTTGVNEYQRSRKQFDFIETTNVFNFRPCE